MASPGIGRGGLVSGFLLCFLVLQALAGASGVFIGLRRHQGGAQRRRPTGQTACDLFSGSWVRDDSYPLYQSLSCPIIDPEFNCQLYGRPDTEYQQYRWRPGGCELPRYGEDGDVRGRLARAESVAVLNLHARRRGAAVADPVRQRRAALHLQVPGWFASRLPKIFVTLKLFDPTTRPLWLLQDSGVSVSFYRAPYLVDIDVVQGRRILMLNEITGNGEAWKGADVLCFNSGHWWTHKGALQGCNSRLIFLLVCCDLVDHNKDKLCRWDYMGDAGSFYEDMDRLVAFQKGMNTWANWVDANVDRTKTKVFFQSISPTHYK
ncbi:hypothetical protein BHE74_00014487 [Ensete ventricosum]|nr:hypothetical protein BHE74_00014487 [Ensete ventricosum]